MDKGRKQSQWLNIWPMEMSKVLPFKMLIVYNSRMNIRGPQEVSSVEGESFVAQVRCCQTAFV